MKKVIRYGVFETNSSSSHAITVMKHDLNSKWRDEKDIPWEEKEIRSPVEKMLFVWGIVTADECYLLQREMQNIEDIEDELERDEYVAYIESKKQKIIENREALIRECKKVQDFDENKVRDLMIEGENNPYYHPLCLRYFNEDCLADCTCYFDLGKLYKELGLDEDKNSIEEFAQALFDESIYFLTEEGFYGGFWGIDKLVY